MASRSSTEIRGSILAATLSYSELQTFYYSLALKTYVRLSHRFAQEKQGPTFLSARPTDLSIDQARARLDVGQSPACRVPAIRRKEFTVIFDLQFKPPIIQ